MVGLVCGGGAFPLVRSPFHFGLPSLAILMVRSPKEGRRINTVWDRTRSPSRRSRSGKKSSPEMLLTRLRQKAANGNNMEREGGGSIGSMYLLFAPLPTLPQTSLVCSILCEHGAQRGARACTMPFSPSFYLRSPVPLSIRVSARAVVSALCVPTTGSSGRRDFDRQTEFRREASPSLENLLPCIGTQNSKCAQLYLKLHV